MSEPGVEIIVDQTVSCHGADALADILSAGGFILAKQCRVCLKVFPPRKCKVCSAMVFSDPKTHCSYPCIVCGALKLNAPGLVCRKCATHAAVCGNCGEAFAAKPRELYCSATPSCRRRAKAKRKREREAKERAERKEAKAEAMADLKAKAAERKARRKADKKAEKQAQKEKTNERDR